MRFPLIKELSQGFVHLLYPHLCEGCSKPLVAGEKVLCIACAMQLPETDYHDIADNETAMRFAGRIPFLHATSYAWFTNDGLLQHLVHGLKYRNKKESGYFLGQRFGEALKETSWIATIDMMVPVPLHRRREAERGYNQSMCIAEGMSAILGIPATDKVLLRARKTDTQTRKTRAERVNNMEGAFTIADGAKLAGKHILICDDVLTTGATIEACALALMREESVKISVATIGIAVS